MLSLNEIKDLLQDRRIDLVAGASGLSYGTVRDIRAGLNRNPTYETLRALSTYLERNPRAERQREEIGE